MLQEFNKQLHTLIQKGYPTLAGMTENEFINNLEPLREKVKNLNAPDIDIEKGFLPFLIVIKSDVIPTTTTMSQVEKNGKTGITKLFPLEPTDFTTIADITLPDRNVYALVDVDRGRETINKSPSEALNEIVRTGRTPLTIDEGIAIVTHYPEFLIKNNCFSLLASRHTGDQRVPAIWINANKHPNLGWCWNGNPHTWLGSASCKKRIG